MGLLTRLSRTFIGRLANTYKYAIFGISAIAFVSVFTLNQEDNKSDVRLQLLEISNRRPAPRPKQIVAAYKTRPPYHVKLRREKRSLGSKGETTPHRPKSCNDLKGQPAHVVLLTYGRSGSSFTADILRRHPDVFFYYEPFHNLAKTFTSMQRRYERQHGTRLYLTSIPSYNKIAQNSLDGLLRCNYTGLTNHIYKNSLLTRSESTRPLIDCTRKAGNNVAEINRCLTIHSVRCSLKPMQLAKTIRFGAQSLEKLMASDPLLKVVFLTRDPRGSFLSKLRAFPTAFTNNGTFEAAKFCPRMTKDVDAIERMASTYPGRVSVNRYEDIAENPLESSRSLYKFLCLNFSQDIEDYITQTNLKGNKITDKNIYSVRRENPKAVSYAWRSKISLPNAKAFDTACAKVYKQLGYLPIRDEFHLRNENVTLKMDIASGLSGL